MSDQKKTKTNLLANTNEADSAASNSSEHRPANHRPITSQLMSLDGALQEEILLLKDPMINVCPCGKHSVPHKRFR